MIYGQEKTREIARSVLASRMRKGARFDLAQAKRNNRRGIRQELKTAYTGRPSAHCYDDETGELDNLHVDWLDEMDYPDPAIKEVVWDRRNRENLGALLRWAPKQVEGVRLLDRTSKMKAIMPDTLQGRHAVSHIDYLDEFYVPTHEYGFGVRRKRAANYYEFWRACEYARLTEALKRILESNKLNAFNQQWFMDKTTILNEAQYLKKKDRYYSYDSSPRTFGVNEDGDYFETLTCRRPLLGDHDIDTWAEDVRGDLRWSKIDPFDIGNKE